MNQKQMSFATSDACDALQLDYFWRFHLLECTRLYTYTVKIPLIAMLISSKIDLDPRNDYFNTEKRSSRNKITNRFAVANFYFLHQTKIKRQVSSFHIHFTYVARVCIQQQWEKRREVEKQNDEKKRNYTEFICRNVCVKLKA